MKKYLPIIFVLACIYAFLPFEWGLMDDSEYVLAIAAKTATLGWFNGTLSRIYEHCFLDISYAGILRPSFWLYTATLYQLPVNIAYATRLFEYLVVVGIIYSLFHAALGVRAGRIFWLTMGMAAVLSVRSLYDGIFFVSLQEFSGLFLVFCAYYLYLKVGISLRSIFPIVFLLFLGIGFKPPFVWLAMIFGIALFFREKKKKTGLLISILGLIYLLTISYLAKHGVYSQQIYKFEMERIFLTIFSFCKHIAPPLVLLSITTWLLLRFGSYKVSWDIWNFSAFTRVQSIGLQLFLGGLAYILTLLPRGIGKGFGYYLGPPIIMILVGFLLVFYSMIDIYSASTADKIKKNFYLKLSLIPSLGIALFIAAYSAHSFYDRMAGINKFKEWAMENESKSIFLGTNSNEVSRRLAEILELRLKRKWSGKITDLVIGQKIPEELNYYLVFSDQVEPEKAAMKNIVWQKGSASLYRLDLSK